MSGIILPGNSFQWVKKMEAIAETSGTSYQFIYMAFLTVKEYYGSANKDRDYWYEVLINNFSMQKADELCNADYSDFDDPQIIKGLECLMEEDLDLSEFDEERKEKLILLARGGTVKKYHAAASKIAFMHLKSFMDIYHKHPFDYVLEDLKDDFETFYRIDLACSAVIKTN